MRNLQNSLAGLLLVSSITYADGNRTYPDPFVRCEDPYLILRTADLTNKFDTQRDSVTVDLTQQQLLVPPTNIQLEGVNLDGYQIETATTTLTGEGSNTCTYKYTRNNNRFELSVCTHAQNGMPTPVHTQKLQLKIPGFEMLSRSTAWAQPVAIQSAQGCGGRTPLNGQKFFNRANGNTKLWFVVLDEAVVSTNSVATVAAQMSSAVGSAPEEIYTTGPLGFALKTSPSGAQTISQDTKVRFVENIPFFVGKGYRDASNSWWAQDRIDQEPPRAISPLDNRLRWPEYEQSNINRPSLFVLDTSVFDSHVAFSGINFQRLDPNPTLPSCAQNEVGADHGTNVAGLLAGIYSGTQNAAPKVYFVKTLGRATSQYGTVTCEAGDGMTVVKALQQVIALARPGDIVNMSFGGTSLSGLIEMQINRLLSMGVVIVAAAGNENSAVSYPPANIPDVITVGGTTSSDDRWIDPVDPSKGTNFGLEVDVFAPAHVVAAPTTASTTASTTANGTSLASPLVAGIVFHNLSSSTNWPQSANLGVAQKQRQELIVQGVSHDTDTLPVLRGKPLERSSVSGAASLASGVIREKLAVDGFGNLWRGRSDNGGTYSLGLLSKDPAASFPDPNTDFAKLRKNKERCLALAGFEGGVHPQGTGDMLVGCYGLGTSYLGIYTAAGEFKEYGIESDDAPISAHTTYQDFTTFGASVGMMKQDGTGGLRDDLVSIVYLGADVNAPNGKIFVQRVDITPTPDHAISLEHVVTRCAIAPPFDCTVWATTTQASLSDSTQFDIVVHRLKFASSTLALLENPTIVMQHSLNTEAACGFSGLGIGFGARGVGVVPDDAGDGFSLFFSTSGSAFDANGTCVRTGGTSVARPGAQLRSLGEGIFASTLSFEKFSRTIILGGVRADRMWNEQSAIISTARAGFVRNVWLPGMPVDTLWAGGPELSVGYGGYFLQADIYLNTSVRWFDP